MSIDMTFVSEVHQERPDKVLSFLSLCRKNLPLVCLIKRSQPPSACQCDLFIQEGARLGRTPAEVVSMCDITFSCVSDPKAARDVSPPT